MCARGWGGGEGGLKFFGGRVAEWRDWDCSFLVGRKGVSDGRADGMGCVRGRRGFWGIP